MEEYSPKAFCGSTRLYSNLYSNADDMQHYLAARSEQQAQAYPVFDTTPQIASHINPNRLHI